jgi:hypothetical protein
MNFQWNRKKNEFYRALRSFQRRRRWRPNRSDIGLATWGARFSFYRPTIIVNKIAFYNEYERNGFFGQLALDYCIFSFIEIV